MSATPRSSEGHLKVTTMSNQQKRVKIVMKMKPTYAPTRTYNKHIPIYLFDYLLFKYAPFYPYNPPPRKGVNMDFSQ